MLKFVAREVAAVMTKGVQVAIVVGGGNYFRGANAWDGLERSTADYIGSAALTKLLAINVPRKRCCLSSAWARRLTESM